MVVTAYHSFAGRSSGRYSIRDTVSTAGQLDSIFSQPVDSVIIILKPGDYHLKPKWDVDTAVEWVNNIPVPVQISYGLKITAKFVNIIGPPNYGATIYTHAGYGLYFVNCKKALIEGVIISGGARDQDPLATDAAIVVRDSKVQIINNLIFDNRGDSATVIRNKQGIMGICGRNRSDLFIFNNQIARNSWNGIGIYESTKATITGNLIDGVDNLDDAVGFGGGRGTGIFVTRNAKVTIETNLVKRYWSGIGVFYDADALVSENLVENVRTWGISVNDADSGRPRARVEKNVVYVSGACGASITYYKEGRSDPGFFINNIVTESGRDRKYDSPDIYCYQCALAVQGRPDKFKVEDNVFYMNTWLAPCFQNMDIEMSTFEDILQTRYSTIPLRWYAGYSEFVQRFYLYLGPKPE